MGAGNEGCVNALCPPPAAVETAVRTAPRPPAGVSGQKRFSTTQENTAWAGAAEGPGDLGQARGEVWDAGEKGKGRDHSCPPRDFDRNKARLRKRWGHAVTPSPRSTGAEPCGGAAVQGQVEALRQPQWDWGAGRSACPRRRPRDPRAPPRAPCEPLFCLCRARS